jgi:1-acyl-sn-glycerol-3-phosphate acyltransferase
MDWRSPLFWTLCATVPIVVSAVFRAATCSAGWRVWLCYRIAVVHRTLFVSCRATNKCPFPEFGPAIIVANHTSLLDAILIWHRHFAQFQKPRLRVIGFMIAKEFYDRRGVVHWVCKAMESIPVARHGRDMGPIREALTRLENGHLLGLFPEGRLNLESPDERLLPGGTGVAWLAIKSRAPVIPVFIHHAPRGESMPRCFLVRTHVTLTYGKPIDLSAWHAKKPGHAELAEVTDLIMKSLADLGGIGFTPITGQCDTRHA